MPVFAKILLGCAGTACAAGGYAFHDGVVRVTVDESKIGGQHRHIIVPAALIPLAARLVPEHHLRHAAEHAAPALPVLTAASKELQRLADTELVRIDSAAQHVRVTTERGYVVIDVLTHEAKVHVSCPLSVIHEVAGQLQELQPAS